MTVQELIDRLERVEDKTKQIEIVIPTEGVADWPVSLEENEETVRIAGADI